MLAVDTSAAQIGAHRKSGAARDPRRMAGLERAAIFVGGQPALASAMGINPRFLRQKITADRPIWDDDLHVAARALAARAREMLALAEKLTALTEERTV